MIEKAKEFFPDKQFFLADVRNHEDLSELHGLGFDTTIAVSLLLHLEKLDAFDLFQVMWYYTRPGGIMVFSMETNGDSEQRRPDGLLIRNQSPESVVKDVLAALHNSDCPPEAVRYSHQKATTSTIHEIYYMKERAKVSNFDQVARTSIFWAKKLS